MNFLRPRFYPGQRLADEDLTALAHWTGTRLEAAQAALGWGILEGAYPVLGTIPKGQTLPELKLSKGFGFNPTGKAFAWAEALPITWPHWDNNPLRYALKTEKLEDLEKFKISVGPYVAQSLQSWIVYDLAIVPNDELILPKAVGSRSNTAKCEPQQIHETAEAVWYHHATFEELKRLGEKREDTHGLRFLEALKAFATSPSVEAADKIPPADSAALKKCFELIQHAKPSLAAMHPAGGAESDQVGWPKLESVRDFLNSLFIAAEVYRRARKTNKSESVPIARFWFNINKSKASLEYVDSAAPRRREFGLDHALPSPMSLIGMDLSTVQYALGNYGWTGKADESSGGNWADIVAMLKGTPTKFDRDTIAIPVVYAAKSEGVHDDLLGRVIGFRTSKKPEAQK